MVSTDSGARLDLLGTKRGNLAPRTAEIEEANLVHVLPHFGGMLTSDVEAADVSRYQQRRLAEEAAPKTVNLEVATVRRPASVRPVGADPVRGLDAPDSG